MSDIKLANDFVTDISGDTDTDYGYEIMTLIKAVDNIIISEATKYFEKMNITATQCTMMIYILIKEGEKVYPVDLEKQFHLSRPTITGILQRLVKRGYITLTPDEKDKRYKYITATEEGRAMRDDIREGLGMVKTKVFENVPDEEKQTAHKVLKTILSNINKYRDEGKAAR